MKKNDLLTITELARLRNTTSETLRHYDRIGLIKPDFIDPHSGYRYYSIRQYEKLGTILELKSLGLSLAEIKDYFDNRNLEKSIEILTKHENMLKVEIQQKITLDKIMERKLRFLNNLDRMPPINTVFIKEYDDRHIITFGEPAGGPREHAFIFTKLEAHLHGIAPILATDRIGVYSDASLLSKSTGASSCVPFIFVDEEENLDSEYLQTIPGGTFLCLYYPEGRLEEYDASYELMNQYISKHNFTINGNILQIYKVDVTITSNRSETILEIQVPVC